MDRRRYIVSPPPRFRLLSTQQVPSQAMGEGPPALRFAAADTEDVGRPISDKLLLWNQSGRVIFSSFTGCKPGPRGPTASPGPRRCHQPIPRPRKERPFRPGNSSATKLAAKKPPGEEPWPVGFPGRTLRIRRHGRRIKLRMGGGAAFCGGFSFLPKLSRKKRIVRLLVQKRAIAAAREDSRLG